MRLVSIFTSHSATDGAINGLPADTPNKLIHMSCDL